MSAPDFYRDWLHIPPGPRPPTHYALLGLEPLESDESKIRAAAAERIKQIRNYALKYPHESTKLLNEVAAAEVCLTHAESRAEYESRLRGAEPSSPSAAASPPAPATPTVHARAADDKTTYDFLPANEPEKKDKPDKVRPPSRPDKQAAAENEDEEPTGPAQRPLLTPARIGAAAAAVVLLVVGAAIVSSIYQGSRHPRIPIAATGTSDRPEVKTATWSKGPPSASPPPVSVGPEPTPIAPPIQAVNPAPAPNPAPGQAVPNVQPGNIALLGGIGEVFDSLPPADVGAGPGKKLYQVRLQAFHPSQMAVFAQDFWTPRVRVLSEKGSLLAEEKPGDQAVVPGASGSVRYVPLESGTYQVEISSRDGNVGAFRLSVVEQPPSPSSPVGLPVALLNGNLDRNDFIIDSDPPSLGGLGRCKNYLVELRAGKTYAIELTRSSPDVWDPYLEVQDLAGRTQASDDNSGGVLDARLLFTPSAAATYRIVAASHSRVGTYQLAVREQPDDMRGKLKSNVLVPAKDPVTVKDALLLTHRRDMLSGGQSLLYAVFLRENRVYRFRLTATAPKTKLQPYLRLNDPEIKPVQSAMNPQGGPAEFVQTATRTGVYEIVASTLTDTGPFELTIIDQGHPYAQGPEAFAGAGGAAGGAARPMMPMPPMPGGVVAPPAVVRNLPIQALKGGAFRTLGTVGRFNRDGRMTDEYAFQFDAGTTYTIDVGTNQFDHQTQVFTDDGNPVKVTVGKVPGLAPKAGVLARRTTVLPEKNGVYHVVVAWAGPLAAAPLGLANMGFDFQLKRGAAKVAKANEPKLTTQTLELVRDAAKADDILKAGEDKAFLFNYPAFRVLTVEVKADKFEPTVRLTLTDGRPVDGAFKEDGSSGRLVYRGTTPSFMRLRVSSADGGAGPFTLRLKLD